MRKVFNHWKTPHLVCFIIALLLAVRVSDAFIEEFKPDDSIADPDALFLAWKLFTNTQVIVNKV